MSNVADEITEGRIALALSGGGFRATLFHLGALWRLNELGVLARLDRISCVSGGSVIGGVLAKAWESLVAAQWSQAAFDAHVVQPVRAFCGRNVDAWAIGEGALRPGMSAAEVVAREYRKHLFDDFALQDLPVGVDFVFNATNLQTGRLVRFSREHIRDYSVGSIDEPKLDLGTVVAASSAFPPFLSPLTIAAPGPFVPLAGAVHSNDRDYTDRLHLTDGGVYDNLGLEPIWRTGGTVLVSDAGAPFQLVDAVETDWIRQTLRALDVATDQARGLRKRWLVERYLRGELAGGYWGIDTDITEYPVAAALPCAPSTVRPLASIRTRLDAFDETEQGQLANWGYVLCDTAIAGRAPQLVRGGAPTAAWPFPAQALGR
ncbi:patatin-like phospholipase family protein [Methylobacterium sp. Leaf456]|uniref:patatin-like phospholipase family protein n=1 Tax=Methylobacterium sp. Leaf456 TaxID=1736382 RepID=UPI00138F5797|nr:patatin-like phospholipase family protein [Methylobacterium sp. Leaf456]